MNVTPGYFRPNGCCGYGYYTDKEVEEYFISHKCELLDCAMPSAEVVSFIRILSFLTRLDFYKENTLLPQCPEGEQIYFSHCTCEYSCYKQRPQVDCNRICFNEMK